MKSVAYILLAALLLTTSSIWLGGCASGEKKAAQEATVYKCPVCGSEFVTESEWIEHIKANHPDEYKKIEKK